LDSVVNHFAQRLHEVLVHELRMEEHLGAQKALVADVDVHHVAVDCAVHELLELVRLDDLACCLVDRLLVERVKLFEYVLAHVSVLLLHFGRNLVRVACLKWLIAVFQGLQHILRDVATCQRNMLHAARNHVAVAHREDVSDAVARINYCACHLRDVVQIVLRL